MQALLPRSHHPFRAIGPIFGEETIGAKNRLRQEIGGNYRGLGFEHGKATGSLTGLFRNQARNYSVFRNDCKWIEIQRDRYRASGHVVFELP